MNATTRRLLRALGLFDPLRDIKLKFRHPDMLVQRRKQEDFYSQWLGRGDLCFDVGANVGQRVEIFLHIGTRVVAVEPQPSCIAALERRFAGCGDLHLVKAAAGSAAGETRMMISDTSLTSTVNQDWAQAVSASGRFRDGWHSSITVPVTTLDKVVEQYGTPHFCKIDVEGHELEVLRGLSQLPRAVSFEFTPEAIDHAIGCVERLASLGAIECNYSLYESLQFAHAEWVSPGRIVELLRAVTDPDHLIFGDVYVQRKKFA